MNDIIDAMREQRLYMPCPKCGGTGYLTSEDESEDNCDLCGTKGFALVADVALEMVNAEETDRHRRLAEIAQIIQAARDAALARYGPRSNWNLLISPRDLERIDRLAKGTE